MILALSREALFCITLFLEAMAALDILQKSFALKLHEAFEPLLDFYHARALPALSFGARLYPGTTPAWFPSAYFIATVFFFLFFVKQAYRAAAPYPESETPQAKGAALGDAAIDAVLPALLCAAGAVVAAATLLPLLTPLPGFWLAVRKAAARPSWFEVSSGFYLNIFLLAAVVLSVYVWALSA